jgi:hypothetical protein
MIWFFLLVSFAKHEQHTSHFEDKTLHPASDSCSRLIMYEILSHRRKWGKGCVMGAIFALI